MSGISALKEKSKKQLEANEKRKMDIGEMFENQSVGKPDNQKDDNPETQQTTHMDIQKPNNPIIQKANLPEGQPPNTPSGQQHIFPASQTNGQPTIQSVGKTGTHADVNPEPQPSRQPTIFSTKQSKNQRIPTCKMTFNLREDIYKAFNDLYAHRILQGRTTEKSEMICEAIQLLIDMEKQAK